MGQLVYLKDVTTLRLDEGKCIGCGMCLSVCPHAVFTLNNGKVAIVDRDACMECGACAQNCPVTALSVRAGVGCATGVINAALGRNNASCCCVVEEREVSGCGCEPSPKASRPGCC